MVGVRVLLVDDEVDFTEVLAERMRARGLRVDVCASGEDALKIAGEKSFDAVILDLAMPGMDGIETLKRLLKRNPDLQVILLTGHATLEKGVEAVKSGAMEFLQKPVDIDILLDKIKEAHEKTTLITEKHIEDTLSKILKKKGW